MNLAISNIGWSKEYDTEMYENMVKYNFKGLEIAPTRIIEKEPYLHIKEAKEFSEKIKKEYNLKIISMQSIWYGKKGEMFKNYEEREELITYTKQAINFAQSIQCNNLVFGCPKNRNIKTKEDYYTAINFFKTIAKYAKEHNTVFSIEANPIIYNTNFINTTKEAFNIVDEINSNVVKVNLDLGTIIANNEDIEEVKGNISKINHIHISEPNLELIIKRDIHIELAKILKESEYNGYISIEMKKTDNIGKIKEIMEYIGSVFK